MQKSRNIFKNSIVVGLIIFMSRISGLFRDFFVAKYLGAGKLADCFLVAFKIPNLFRSIFAEGAFNSSFIPIFSTILDKNRSKALVFCKSIFSFLFYILLVFVLVSELVMPFIVDIFAPGFFEDSNKYNLTVSLSRITFPFLFFIAITSFFGSILNALGLFKPYALSPIILNLCIISSFFLLGKFVPTFAHAASWGVFISGILQLLFLFMIAKKYGFGVISFKPVLSSSVNLFFIKILPGILGAGIYHINVMIGSFFASSSDGAISWLYYADRLVQLPVGVIGVAIATVMLPNFSRQVQKNNWNKTKLLFNNYLKFSTILVMPATLSMISISYLLVNVFFERGVFISSDTLATSIILKILSLSLPALVYTKLFANVFYARYDTKTPMLIACFSMLVDLFLTMFFYNKLQYIGIAISITICNWITCLLLYCIAYKRRFIVIYKSIFIQLVKILFISLFIALVLYFSVNTFVITIVQQILPVKLLILLFIVFCSILSYFALLWLFKIVRVKGKLIS